MIKCRLKYLYSDNEMHKIKGIGASRKPKKIET